MSESGRGLLLKLRTEKGLCNGEEDALKVPKYFVGQKLEWLKSKSLVSYGKFLKTNDKKQLEEAIRYADAILSCLESQDREYHPFSVRQRLGFPGPSPDIRDIIGDLRKYKIFKVLNYAAYFVSADKRFVLAFPTTVDFYFSSGIVDKNNQPLLGNQRFILDLYAKECFGILDYLDIVVHPSQSNFYRMIDEYLAVLVELQERAWLTALFTVN